MADWQEIAVAELAAKSPNALATGPFGSAISSKFFEATGVPVIRGSNLSDALDPRLIDDNFVFVSPVKASEFGRSVVRRGDLVFTCWGTVGQVGLIDERAQYDEYVVSNKQMKLTPNPQIADSLFLYYVFSTPPVSEAIKSQAIGSSVPGFNLSQLRSIRLRLPPIAEQRAITSVLGALDDKIEQNRRTARALERLARAIFQAWFVDFEPVKAKATGATAFPSMPQPVFDAMPTRFVDSAIGPVPEGWEVKAIGDVVTAKGGGTPSTKNADYWDGGEYCWATPKDMSRLAHPVLLDTERRITDAGVNAINSGVLPAGTVLMSSRAPVGYLAIAGVPTAINQGFIAMVCDGPLPPTYVLNWAFASMDAIKAHASGTTFPEISKKTFRPLPVVVPTPDVITAYQQAADPLFDLLIACVKESEQLGVMRDYLLPKLLSGDVRVEATHA